MMKQPVTLILIGLLLTSFGFNLMQHSKIAKLEQCLCESNMWLSAYEFSQIKNEIQRLDGETKSVLKK